jgi:hypothetical protein
MDHSPVGITVEARHQELLSEVAAEEKCSVQELLDRWAVAGFEELVDETLESGTEFLFRDHEQDQSTAAEVATKELDAKYRILFRIILRRQSAKALCRRRRAAG